MAAGLERGSGRVPAVRGLGVAVPPCVARRGRAASVPAWRHAMRHAAHGWPHALLPAFAACACFSCAGANASPCRPRLPSHAFAYRFRTCRAFCGPSCAAAPCFRALRRLAFLPQSSGDAADFASMPASAALCSVITRLVRVSRFAPRPSCRLIFSLCFCSAFCCLQRAAFTLSPKDQDHATFTSAAGGGAVCRACCPGTNFFPARETLGPDDPHAPVHVHVVVH